MKGKINGWVSRINTRAGIKSSNSITEVIAAEEQRMKERQAQHEIERKTIREAEERAHQKH